MYEMELSQENIEKTLIDDVLGRNDSIFNFLKLIYSIKDKCTVSIDGDWGTGKTFFVKQIELVMNLLNSEKEIDLKPKLKSLIDKKKNKLKNLGINTYGNTRAIYYNACEYDYFTDPIITIIADIIKNNSEIYFENPEQKKSIGEKLDKFISTFKFGVNFQNGVGLEIQKECKDEDKDILDSIIISKQIEENFKSLLEELLIEKSNRLVIFIDELDRSNPIFTVKLFEKIKYFFNDDRFIFVFSTNLNQLQYTIEKYYGDKFNGSYYLQKFFDYQLELPEIDLNKYIDYSINLISVNSDKYMDTAILEILKYKKFYLRDCNKFFQLLKLKYEELKCLGANLSYFLFIGILFPVLLAVKIKDINEYRKIKSGKGKEEFCNIVSNCETITFAIKSLTNNSPVNRNEIEELYEFMFIHTERANLILRSQFNVKRFYIMKMNELLTYLGEKNVI